MGRVIGIGYNDNVPS